ncbi:MAG: GFA family protein [Polyangia bacterium]
MSERHASCSCGQLRLSCKGEPLRISMCHCLACQKRTGSVFGVQARFHKNQVRTEGQATEYVRTGDSGSRATFRFCPTCGSTVYWLLEAMPDLVAVAVGAFADPRFPSPRVSVYEERMHPWTGMQALPIEHMG